MAGDGSRQTKDYAWIERHKVLDTEQVQRLYYAQASRQPDAQSHSLRRMPAVLSIARRTCRRMPPLALDLRQNGTPFVIDGRTTIGATAPVVRGHVFLHAQ